MRDYEEIRNFQDPLSLKKLNDQLRLLWFKNKNVTGKDIRFDTISADQIVVGENASLGSEVQSIIDGKVEPSGVVSIINGTVTADYIEALQVVARRLTTLSGPTILADVYKDAYGGKLKINNNSGNLVAAMGVESGSGDNRNGTLVLYDGSPYDFSPYKEAYQRVEAGIAKSDGAGLLNLRDSSAKVRIELSASARRISIRDSNENVKTWFTETAGYINGETIATQWWVQNGLSSISVSGGITAGGDLRANSGTCWASRLQWGSRSVNVQSDTSVMVVYSSGTPLFVVKSDGTKIGGVVMKDGHNYYMSPVDSPRILIQDIILDVQLSPDGVVVPLNPELAEIIDGYAVVCSGNVQIVEKQTDHFIAKGEGVVDFLITANRYDHKDEYWSTPELESVPTQTKFATTSNMKTLLQVDEPEDCTVANITLSGQTIEKKEG